ncbi:MAG: ScyD/ScyE family protein [Microlunatus sp.]|nr:ScyD/ScyE family protein [Microlunatus sp.]
MRTSRLLGAAALAASLLLIPPSLASAHPRPAPTPSVELSGLGAPFNLEIKRSHVYFADGGLNLVGRVKSGGTFKTLAANQAGASGVALSRNGKHLAFTTTETNENTFENTASGLNLWGPRGKRIYADTLAYEKAKNPDKINFYGVRHPSQCQVDALAGAGIPVGDYGQVDSHAYSVAAWAGGWVVADAGSNTLWWVNRKGKIKTMAVLPPQPTRITAAMATSLGLDPCVAGITYNFEPVPTDVEVGRDGFLYVTTLPGGPEGPELGARGKVWRVNPFNGRARAVASGFLGATNLALGKHGEIYVAELFAGRISTVYCGRAKPYLTLPGVVAVETSSSGELWAATLGNEDPPAPGTIVKITKGKPHQQAKIRP